jgi:Arc/MetJ-type ribon-helix-helix transcriptional regulator
VKADEGISESEQIRQALRDWLRKKGVKKTGRKRAVTRKRP